MTTLYIDADACPVIREALACARKARVPAAIVGNSTQNLARHVRRSDPRRPEDARAQGARSAEGASGFWVDIVEVSVGADSADFAIVERLQPGDVVVTQDIGLAAMVLGRGGAAIGPRGHVHTKATIDMELYVRHEEKKVRRAGGRTRGPAAFTDEDRETFSHRLDQLLKSGIKGV